MRYAILSAARSVKLIESYLPANYQVIHVDENGQGVLIAGIDNAGWTLDGYVIPRFLSGLITCREVFPVFVVESGSGMGPGYCMDVPDEWLRVDVPQSDEAQERKNANLVEVIISHEACDDLVRNDETSWTCELSSDFVLDRPYDTTVTRLTATLEQIFEMLDSDQLRRIQL